MDFANFWWQAGGPNPDLIPNSLRFRGGQKLTRTPSVVGNRRVFTTSYWVKRGTISTPGYTCMFNAGASTTNNLTGNWYIRFRSDDALNVGAYGGALLNTDGKYRDPSAWMHVVIAVDQNNTAQSGRAYVNGELVYASNAINSTDTACNNTVLHAIGYFNVNASEAFDGYLAEFHHVDGQQLDPTSFGEYDDNGVWIPKKVSGLTYGTNGFYLDFSNPSNIGDDKSGNGNHFTATGFELTDTSSASYDLMEDSPTNNYNTWNAAGKPPRATLSDGNLTATGSGPVQAKGTQGLTEGKWYWEVTGLTGQFMQGIVSVGGYTYDSHDNWRRAVYYYTDGASNHAFARYENGGRTTIGVPTNFVVLNSSDILQVAFDADSGKVWFGRNNSWADSTSTTTGNPTTGANPVMTLPDMTVPMTPFRDDPAVSNTSRVNFGQRPFQYAPPAGFKGLSTAALPAVDITNPKKHFNTVLYTGNNANNTITGVGFSPDLVWIKERSSQATHNSIDSVRGVRNHLSSNLTNGEYLEAAGSNLTSFDSDGFTLGLDNAGPGRVNSNGQTYVAWCWNAGTGSPVTNTAGSITSTVKANQEAGFSIVTYTGNASAGATIGHGLNSSPKLILVKNRVNGGEPFQVYHSSLGATKYLQLSSTAGEDASVTRWNNTEPTPSVFSVGTYPGTNESGSGMVAYCWSEIPGYSAFGSYQGNASNDGPFIYTGFRPAFVMIKNASTGADWVLIDTKRSTYNPCDKIIYPSTSAGEDVVASSAIDFVSNGFKHRGNWSAMNQSNTYIYAAFAEHPFGGSNVYPSPAR